MKEEIFQPYPPNRVATRFRSTWLSSSLKAMRQRGLLDRYLSYLPEKLHDEVMHAAAGYWLPVRVAIAHYDAMSRLEIPDGEAVQMGMEITDRFHGLVFSTVFRLAQTVGASPWTVLASTQKLWDRAWIGGGIAIFKLGPREARGEFVGWPCSRFRYPRVAMRGVMLGTVSLFCKKAWVQEIPQLCTETTLGYRMTWV